MSLYSPHCFLLQSKETRCAWSAIVIAEGTKKQKSKHKSRDGEHRFLSSYEKLVVHLKHNMLFTL